MVTPMTSSPRLRLSVIVRLLLVGLLTAFALSANANVNWAGNNYGYFGGASSPEAECQIIIAGLGQSPGHAVYVSDKVWSCNRSTDNARYDLMVAGGVCDAGTEFAPSTGTCVGVQTFPAMDATTACAGYPNTAALAAADSWVREPRTFAYNVGGANGVATITGGTAVAGKSYTYGIDCYGKGRIGDGDGTKLPAPTPSPAPAVDTAYPKCGVGNYLYTDETGQSTCSQNLPDRTVSDCASKNGGYVNGKAVCLPANPAPAVAAASAATAQQKANDAVAAGRGTSGAVTAANDAATAYKRAAEAANSMPSSTPAATSAAMAYGAATQAAIAAGMSVPAPLPNPGTATGTGTGGAGTGTADTGPKECGTPGKPKCQIDETGTPDGKGAMDAADTALKATTTDIQTGIDSAGSDSGKSANLGGWMPVMPAGSCTDPQVRNSGSGAMESVPICDKLPPITMGMELLWAAFFGFAIMGLISNAMSKS